MVYIDSNQQDFSDRNLNKRMQKETKSNTLHG